MTSIVKRIKKSRADESWCTIRSMMLVPHGGKDRRGSRRLQETMKDGGDERYWTVKGGQQWRWWIRRVKLQWNSRWWVG